VERRKYGKLMMISSRAPGKCDTIELITAVQKERAKYQQGVGSLD
jgi:hypothetical protein